MPVTNLAELDALVTRVKAAQEEFATFFSRESRCNLPRSFSSS